MKVLFVGGTGLISSACTRLAVERGVELFLLNRGSDPDRGGATSLVADAHDEAATEGVLAGHGSMSWSIGSPTHRRTSSETCASSRHRTDQFVFISSASAYLSRSATGSSARTRRSPTRSGTTRRTRSPAKNA